MSWRDSYQPGSFRGVPFVTESHERSGGRRVETHEFPGRDDPLTEDLGRRARQFRIECFVFGDDYYPARDALIDALEATGPATLIHPWHGSRYVNAMEFSTGEDQAGGYAWFSITFGEAGAEPSLTASPDTAVQARAVAAETLDEAPAKFADRFSIDSLPGFIEEAADTLVSSIASVSEIAAGLAGGVGSTLSAFDSALRLVGADGLLRTPLALGSAIVGLVSAISVLGGTGSRQTAALRYVGVSFDGVAIPGSTPARDAQRENQAALVHIVRSSVAAELVNVTSSLTFASYDEAAVAQLGLADLLDRWAVEAADAGEDKRADVFDSLRLALVRDVAARGGSLARQYAYPLASTQPALVIAGRLYGPVDDLDDRAADLVARNTVAHPGFVPGGLDLQVLTNG